MKRFFFLAACLFSVQSLSPAQNILVLEDGGTQDSVFAILTQAGFNVTLGGPYWTYTGIGINQYQLVIFLNGVVYANGMADSVQLKIRNYVGSGGGLLTTEWILWGDSSFVILASILPSRYDGTYAYAPELYRKRATHAISQNLPDSFYVPNDWSFSNTVRDTAAAKQAITIFSGALSGDAVVAGRYGQGKVVHWNMGGHYIGPNIWSAQVKTLLRNIAAYTQGVSAVGEPGESPLKFSLAQNYPNPFNPSTRIRFSIPVGMGIAPSVLKVYDLLGREVRTLVNENLPAGSYEVTFDAEGLSSGVYFYRLSTPSFVQTKRLVLLR